jgi:SAM-dependent methyltransferase
MSDSVDLYTASFSRFGDPVLARVRQEAYGEDIGQNSWLAADEYRTYVAWLQVGAGSHVLEVGCGAGGPALFLASLTGAQVTGLDVNAHGIAAGNAMAREQHLEARVRFEQADASGTVHAHHTHALALAA